MSTHKAKLAIIILLRNRFVFTQKRVEIETED